MIASRTNWAALIIGLLVLFAAGAAMILNPVGLTGGIHAFEYQTLQRLFPSAAAAAPPAPLIATIDTNLGAAPWLANAAALWPQLLFALVAGLIVVALLSRNRSVLAGLFTVLAIAAALALNWLMFTRAHLSAPALAACFVLALTFALGILAAGLQPASREPPPRVSAKPNGVAPVAAQPIAADLPEVHGERRTVSCLVCRIAGLSGLAETLDPDSLLRLARDTLHPAQAAAAACGGAIVQSKSDVLKLVWNAEHETADPAAHACDAALRISAAMRDIQEQHGEGTPYDRLHLEIGIGTGPAVFAGEASQRMPFALHGACIDRAEQLSALCERYGAVILIDRATRDAVEQNFAVLEVDSVETSAGSSTLYALYGNPVVRASPRFHALSACNDRLFRALRERRWADARAEAAQCRELSGAIPALYDCQLARLDWYEQHPPPDDWDGAFRPPIV